jgi:hypothetical protein
MSRTRMWPMWLFVLLLLGMAACAQQSTEQPPENETNLPPSTEPRATIMSPSGTQRPVPPLPHTPDFVQPTLPPVSGEAPQELIDKIIDDLAAHLNVERQSIAVVGAASVTWNDGAMGCPKPGMFYTQMVVPGYQIILEADGIQYDYHASDKGYFVLCEAPLPGHGPSGPSTPAS